MKKKIVTESKHRFQAKQIRRLYEDLSVDLEKVSELFEVAPAESREKLVESIAKSWNIDYKRATNKEAQVRTCCAAILESLQAKHEI